MPRRFSPVVGLLAAFGCTGAPEAYAVSPAASPRPESAVAGRATRSQATEPAGEPAQPSESLGPVEAAPLGPIGSEVQELASALCAIPSRPEGWSVALPLRFHPTGAAFAEVRRAPATLELSAAGPTEGGRIAVEADGFAIHGRVRAADLVLNPSRPMAIGVVVPKQNAAMRWLSNDGTRPSVALKLEGSLKPLGARSIVWSAECADLSLGQQTFDARAATGLGKPRDTSYIAGPRAFRITLDRASGPSLRVVASPGQHRVEVHATDQDRAQILFVNANSLLFGWVDQNLLRDKTGIGGSGGGRGEGRSVQRLPESVRVRCGHPLEIVALLGNGGKQRGVVGGIRAGTELWIVPSRAEGGHVELAKLPDWLQSVAGARLAVPAAKLDACERAAEID